LEEVVMSDGKPKPIGSGFFSLAAGVIFLLLFIGSYLYDLRKIDPYKLFQYWLLFASAILTIWGIRRVAKVWKEEYRWEVGQPTLNFVVGVIAATVAIFTLIVQHGP
jgi:Kef-type K+ transport system membrane component KefB